MFNEKSQFRVSIYIYTVLCDSTPEQHEIENYEKKGLKHHKTIYIIYIHVILTFYKGKVARHFAGAFFRIYIYIRETSIYDKLSSQIEMGLNIIFLIINFYILTTVDPKQWVDSRRVEEQGQTHDMRKH